MNNKNFLLIILLSVVVLITSSNTDVYADEGVPCTSYNEQYYGGGTSVSSITKNAYGFIPKGYSRGTNESRCSLDSFMEEISLNVLLKRLENTFFSYYKVTNEVLIHSTSEVTSDYRNAINSLMWLDIAVDANGKIDLNFSGKEGFFKIDDDYVLYTILRKEYGYSKAVPVSIWENVETPEKQSIHTIVKIIEEIYIKSLMSILNNKDAEDGKKLMRITNKFDKSIPQVIEETNNRLESTYQAFLKIPDGEKFVQLTKDLIAGIDSNIASKFWAIRNNAFKKQLALFNKEKELGKKNLEKFIQGVNKKTKIPINILKLYFNAFNPQPMAFFINNLSGKITYEKLRGNEFILHQTWVDPVTKKRQNITYLFSKMSSNYYDISRLVANNNELSFSDVQQFILTFPKYKPYKGEYLQY